ncbi:MAG: CHRD domain-containing protein [Candidatus Rokubacteria bacterium]|nr:CHRD domain-containing protein [Candidatus Rokubacteria bacterium]MBI3826029.1 CHRD domain-containing protein [Candidatus Rokubacteria bacterium]
MSALRKGARRSLWVGVGVAAIVASGCAEMMSSGGMGSVTLSGSQEVPAVTTAASGKGTITVAADKSVSGSVTTSGVAGTAAHIHLAAAGQNGPVIVPLSKTSDNVWSVAAGAKLTDAQYDAYKAGNLYVNVHSDANKAGEIRGQLKP